MKALNNIPSTANRNQKLAANSSKKCMTDQVRSNVEANAKMRVHWAQQKGRTLRSMIQSADKMLWLQISSHLSVDCTGNIEIISFLIMEKPNLLSAVQGKLRNANT